MVSQLSIDRAKEIVETVLSSRGALIRQWLGVEGVASALVTATFEGAPIADIAQSFFEQEERRRTRIQILRDLIEDLTTYPAYPANFAPLQGDSGQMNELQLRLSALHEKSLGGVIEDLKVMLTVEEQLASEVLAFRATRAWAD